MADGSVDFFEQRFEREGNARRAAQEKAYMKSDLDFHGVSLPAIRLACREYCRAHPSPTRTGLRRMAAALFRSRYFDLHSAAIGVLERERKVLEPQDADWLVDLVRKAACWAHVDWLACKVIGDLTTRYFAQLTPLLRAWAKDQSFWVRRTALLAQVDELRAGRGDFALFAELAVPMLGEKEFFIRKALGWVLRETTRKQPELAFAFLLQHRGEVSGLTLREGAKHLPGPLRSRLGLP